MAGFDTLGRVVEVASGLPFERFLKQRIFEPLGMKTTAFHPGDDRWGSVVTAYHRTDGTLKKVENPNRLQSKTYFSGAGGLVSTAEDYAQFAMMLVDGGQLNGKRLLIQPDGPDVLTTVSGKVGEVGERRVAPDSIAHLRSQPQALVVP